MLSMKKLMMTLFHFKNHLLIPQTVMGGFIKSIRKARVLIHEFECFSHRLLFKKCLLYWFGPHSPISPHDFYHLLMRALASTRSHTRAGIMCKKYKITLDLLDYVD